MTITSDREALIAAIVDNPKDDTSRTAFADYLKDEGNTGPHDTEWGELIQVQCWLAIHPGPLGNVAIECEHGYDVCPTCDKEWLINSARESALLSRNRAAWSRWKCPECDGIGLRPLREGQERRSDREECPICPGFGDLFHGCPIHFRRGFPFAVEVPDMGWVCREEPWRRYRMEVESGESTQLNPPKPTPWLRAVARHTTIEEVWVMDRVPCVRSTEPPEWYWNREGIVEHARLPACIFDLLKEGKLSDSGPDWTFMDYPSPDAARSALGRAIIAWARGKEVRG